MAGGQGKSGCLQCPTPSSMPSHRRVRRNRAGGTRRATAQDCRGTEGHRNGARIVAAPEKEQGTQNRDCKPQLIELSCFFPLRKPRTRYMAATLGEINACSEKRIYTSPGNFQIANGLSAGTFSWRKS